MLLMVFYRRNLLVLSLVNFLASCSLDLVVPFLPLFVKELGVKSGVTLWAGVMLAVPMTTAIVMMPYWGKLADQYGRKLMIIRPGICLFFIYLGMSSCQTLWQLLLLRVLHGALTGFIPASLTLVATNTPTSKAVRYVAVVQSAIAFGGIVGPSVGSIMVEWVGYRDSMLVSGIMMAVAVLLVALLVEERHKVTGDTQPTSLKQDFRLAFKKPVLVMVGYSNMTYSFVMTASQPILVLYIQELIGSQANLFTGPIFSLPGLAILLTNYCWCRLGERYTFPIIILLGLGGAGIFTVLQGLIGSIWWFAAAYFLAGLFAAAVSPNTAGLVATKVEAEFHGRAFAIQQSFQNLSRFFAPLLTGCLGSFLSLQWIFIIVGLIGLTAAAAIRLQLCGCKHYEVM
jgi:DHA1 family multidrug resistance protein-like MFS transporter